MRHIAIYTAVTIAEDETFIIVDPPGKFLMVINILRSSNTTQYYTKNLLRESKDRVNMLLIYVWDDCISDGCIWQKENGII
jgi:hypothetical protein